MKLTKIVPLVMLTMLLFGADVYSRPVVGVRGASQTAMMQVVLHLRQEANAKSLLHEKQAEIQRIERVRQVTVRYAARELSVRYLGMESGNDHVLSAIYEAVSGGAWQIGEPAVAPVDKVLPRNLVEMAANNVRSQNAYIQCLRDDMAHALCERHLSASTLDTLDLEKCYVFKIDVEAAATPDSSNDISARAALEAENGEMVRPLHWFQLPASASQKGSGPPNVSGLLIFPKIPIAGVGLTLRLLRANGDGYDSYTVDVPKK